MKMTDLLFQMSFNNVCISFALAITASIVGITFKRPIITHLLWLLVFVKLLTPPIITVPAIPIPWMSEATPAISSKINEQHDFQPANVSGSMSKASLSTEMRSGVLLQAKHWLLIVWALGSLAVLIWSIFQICRFHRLLRKESETGSPERQSAAKEIAACLGLKTVPTIHTTSASISPMVWWIFGKVWVVIPAALFNQMNENQIRWILSHELAHVRRRDYMVRWIEWLACVCFWWNPIIWWARYNLRANEELCCDALVLSSMKPKPYIYGDSLLKAVEILACPVNRPPVIASGINGGELLKRRVKMIISKKLIGSDLRWLKTAIMLGALIVLPLGLINAQDDKKISPRKGASDLSHEEILAMKEKEILKVEAFLKQGIETVEKALVAGDIPEEDGKVKLELLVKRLAALRSNRLNSDPAANFVRLDYVVTGVSP
jgi:beta-lactamase regulating signal transducer with metallopeptidase domain